MDESTAPMLKLKVLHRTSERSGRTRQGKLMYESWFQFVTTADVVPLSTDCQSMIREAIPLTVSEAKKLCCNRRKVNGEPSLLKGSCQDGINERSC